MQTHQPMRRRKRLVFAARPDAGVLEPLSQREDLAIEVHEALRGAALVDAARGAEILVTRAWQRLGADELRAAAAGGLRAIVQGSSGQDNIDVDEAARLGIRVAFPDPGNAVAVAELTILSILVLLRDVRRHWDATPSGTWPDRDALVDREMRGKTLGLVGLGRVGTRVCRRARAFEAHVLAYDPYLDKCVFEAAGAERVAALDEMIPRSDILSIHCPLTNETRGMIDARRLAHLPEGSILVNTARGGIVREDDLLAALDAGLPAAAVLDVFEEEPVAAGAIAAHPRVLATPHAAGHTAESHRERAHNLVVAIRDVLDSWPEETS